MLFSPTCKYHDIFCWVKGQTSHAFCWRIMVLFVFAHSVHFSPGFFPSILRVTPTLMLKIYTMIMYFFLQTWGLFKIQHILYKIQDIKNWACVQVLRCSAFITRLKTFISLSEFFHNFGFFSIKGAWQCQFIHQYESLKQIIPRYSYSIYWVLLTSNITHYSCMIMIII